MQGFFSYEFLCFGRSILDRQSLDHNANIFFQCPHQASRAYILGADQRHSTISTLFGCARFSTILVRRGHHHLHTSHQCTLNLIMSIIDCKMQFQRVWCVNFFQVFSQRGSNESKKVVKKNLFRKTDDLFPKTHIRWSPHEMTHGQFRKRKQTNKHPFWLVVQSQSWAIIPDDNT